MVEMRALATDALRENVRRCLGIMVGNVAITAAYAFITVPNEIINGGVTSFSMVLERITGVNLSLFVNGITLALLAACLVFLGRAYFAGSVVSCMCYLAFFTVFHATGFSIALPPLACAIVGGLLVGAGYYCCIHAKSTTVGFDAIALMLHTYHPKFNMAATMWAINVLVLLTGLAVYGLQSVVLGILFSAVQAGTLNILQKRIKRS